MVKSRPGGGGTASPRRPRPAQGASVAARRQRANTRLAYDVLGVTLVAVALVLLVTLLWPQGGENENVFGRAVVGGLRLLVGAGAWVFPFVLLLCGGLLATGRGRAHDNVGAAGTLFLLFVTWWHLAHVSGPVGHFHPDNLLAYGGYVGAALSFVLRTVVGTVGGHIVLLALSLVATVWLIDMPLPALVTPVLHLLRSGARAGTQAVAENARAAREKIEGAGGTSLAPEACSPRGEFHATTLAGAALDRPPRAECGQCRARASRRRGPWRNRSQSARCGRPT